MKKILCVAITLLMLAALLAGCGDATTEKKKKPATDPLDPNVAADTMIEVSEGAEMPAPPAKKNDIFFMEPVKAVPLDITLEDPSNSLIQFTYDELGRVSGCTYKADDHDIKLTYEYYENKCRITGFTDGERSAGKTVTLETEYSEDVGFAIFEFYYFKGFTFTVTEEPIS